MGTETRLGAAPKDDGGLVNLDLLRGGAALLVLLEHARSVPFLAFGSLPAAEQTIVARLFYLGTRLGQEAVVLFFVLSGFLVGGQVIRKVREGRFDARDYAIDRASRILPPLIPAVLIAVAAGAIWHGTTASVHQAVGNSVGLNGVLVETLPLNIPLWSLSYEIWFYVLAGAGAVLCVNRSGLAAVVAMVAAMLVFARLEASLMLIWMLGAFIAATEVGPRKGLIALCGVPLLICGIAAIQFGRASEAMTTLPPFYWQVGRQLFAAGFVLMLPWLTSQGPNRLLARLPGLARAAGLLAAMSYTLYLTHYPVLAVIGLYVERGGMEAASFVNYAVIMVVCFAFASVMYVLFERQTPRVRNWLKAKLHRRRAADGAIGALIVPEPQNAA